MNENELDARLLIVSLEAVIKDLQSNIGYEPGVLEQTINVLNGRVKELQEVFIEGKWQVIDSPEVEQANQQAEPQDTSTNVLWNNPANVLWIADDGSWGSGDILVVDTNLWSAEQHAWFERYLDESGDEPEIDVVADINNNVEPEWDQD